jgi:hypothetical protein
MEDKDQNDVESAEKSNEKSGTGELKDDQVEKISGGVGRCAGCGAPLGGPHNPGCPFG